MRNIIVVSTHTVLHLRVLILDHLLHELVLELLSVSKLLVALASFVAKALIMGRLLSLLANWHISVHLSRVKKAVKSTNLRLVFLD